MPNQDALKIYRMDNGLGQCMELICTEGVIFGTSQMGWEMGWEERRTKKTTVWDKREFSG